MLLACCFQLLKFRHLILLSLLIVITGCSSNDPLASKGTSHKQSILFFATATLSGDQQVIRFHRNIITTKESYWQLDLYDLPLYRHSGIRLQHHLNITTGAELTLTRQQHLILRSPTIRPPLSLPIYAQWLMIRPVQQSASDKIWHAPEFTPDIAESARLETLRRAKLAESMADDAYFFGYSTNADALE